MGIIWLILVLSVIGLIWCGWHFWRRGTGRVVADPRGVALPWYVDATFALVFGIGIISTVPGLFFQQPHWAIDYVWRIIARVTGNAG